MSTLLRVLLVVFLTHSNKNQLHCFQFLPVSLSSVPKIPKVPAVPSITDVPGVSTLTGAVDTVGNLPLYENGADVDSGETPERDFDDYIDPDSYVPDVGLISSDPNLIRFLLHSDPSNPSKFEVLEYGNLDSVRRSNYDPTKPVKFLVHGFQNNYNSSFPQNAKNAYLSRFSDYNYNIIIVDWGLLAIPNAPYIAPVFYPFAVNNVWKTGLRLGEFISWLKEESLIDLGKVHILGFSLGSHVSGKAGDVVKETFGQRVARITALDPAGPEFYTGIFARKITPEDAEYVDAIHTNAGQLGIYKNVGKADFYVNGGTGPQPGCISFKTLRKAASTVTGNVSGACSHQKATKFYAKTIRDGLVRGEEPKLCSCSSITQYKLTSSCCDSEVIFGEYCRPSTLGTHYITYKG